MSGVLRASLIDLLEQRTHLSVRVGLTARCLEDSSRTCTRPVEDLRVLDPFPELDEC
jgi:hypothetical protein